jgi:hypothetical protein
MIRKREDTPYTDDVLRISEADIKRETSYAIKLSNKEFEFFDIPKDENEYITPNVTVNDYNALKEDFEKNHFYYYPTNSYAEIADDGSIVFYQKEHALEYFSVKYIIKHSDKFGHYTSFFPLWLKDNNRRTVRLIDYKPTDDDSVYVQPLQFAYETVGNYSEKAVEQFKTLLNIATNNDETLYNYLLKYIAHIIQQPFDLPGVAIVLTGGKGAGKDTLGDFIGNYLIGSRNAYNYNDNDQFFEKHDTNRLGKFFIKLEEADTAICGRNQQTLKARITSGNTTVNPKGEKAITQNNYTRYMFTTNDAVPVNINDGERRFVLLRTDNKYIGNIKFWESIRTTLMTADGGYSVGKYLMTIDLKGFEVRKLPQNEYHNAMVEVVADSEERFLNSDKWDGSYISAAGLFELYAQFCMDNHLPYCRNVKSFGHKLAKFYRDNKVCRRLLDGSNLYYKPDMA